MYGRLCHSIRNDDVHISTFQNKRDLRVRVFEIHICIHLFKLLFLSKGCKRNDPKKRLYDTEGVCISNTIFDKLYCKAGCF